MTLRVAKCAPRAAGLSGRTGAPMGSEQLERGLQASVKIFEFSKGRLVGLAEDEECSVTRDEMVGIKKAAAAMNRALTALVRDAHERENRLTLEMHMLRGIMKREHTDREANRARVFEMFRRYSADDAQALAAAPSAGAASSSMNSNPLNAPSASAVAVDKALTGLERIEQSMRDISPVGCLNIHGAGLLAAKLKRDELVAVSGDTSAQGLG
tara:strand:+ start:811 stop:1446 length:636 start_codon:yes stop_codon:yes gene_type:complete